VKVTTAMKKWNAGKIENLFVSHLYYANDAVTTTARNLLDIM
jgi:hypothetical protein